MISILSRFSFFFFRSLEVSQPSFAFSFIYLSLLLLFILFFLYKMHDYDSFAVAPAVGFMGSLPFL